MIGNDVIDISQTRRESNWRRWGFLDKLFTPDEQLIIANNHDPEITVWKLWSIKEAVYKIYNRQTGVRACIPKQLICNIDTENNGTVTLYNNLYHSKTIVENNCIYTIATTHECNLANIYELHDPAIIKDANGLPYILNKQNKMLQPVSVSHHGHYYRVATINTVF